MNGNQQASNVGPQKCDLKLSVLCQLAWFFSLLFLHCSSAHTLQDVTKTRNGERGTGEPLGVLPLVIACIARGPFQASGL